MPQLLGLLGDRVDQMRVAVAERGDGDAAGEIEKLAAVGGVKIAAFAPLGGDVPPAIGRHNRCNHGILLRDRLAEIRIRRDLFDASIVVVVPPAARSHRRCCSVPARQCRDRASCHSPRHGRPAEPRPPHYRAGKRRSMMTSPVAVNSPRGSQLFHRGSVLDPIRNSSIARAHWRPSRIAQTTSDWPRRMSPAANTFGTEVL